MGEAQGLEQRVLRVCAGTWFEAFPDFPGKVACANKHLLCAPTQLARSKVTGEQAAIKFIERGDRVNKYVEAEILNHRMLRHPHVIELKEVFLTPEFICIVMEFATGE
jgi:hypothetical protein